MINILSWIIIFFLFKKYKIIKSYKKNGSNHGRNFFILGEEHGKNDILKQFEMLQNISPK
jgi:hypothetical protein